MASKSAQTTSKTQTAPKATQQSKTNAKLDKAVVDVAKEKLFRVLVQGIRREFKQNGDKLVKKYGKTSMRETVLKKLNKSIECQVGKKMDEFHFYDVRRVQKQFKILSENINKEATKVDKVLKRAEYISKKGGQSLEENPVKTSVEHTIKRCQTLVEKYVENMGKLDTAITPSSWFEKIKRAFGFGG